MKLNTFMIITAIVAFIFGVGFIVAPAASLRPYGNTTGFDGSIHRSLPWMPHLVGVRLPRLAYQEHSLTDTARDVLTGLFVAMVLGFVVALYDKFAGTAMRSSG